MTTDLRSDLDTALRSGKSPKEFAHEAGISVSWTYRLAWDIGWHSMFLSEGERRLIKQLRAQRIK